ncbi:hypothetical protein GE061_000006 [Apolygus lucorum]|uniref:Uncharacterized protein n=1 Tax=Apolygus lucorum TaxID=248454 RepID=A0A8S9Y756_APOLU|nr:hypothetical protein GE061_000006 [Apolygus lucorum]
MQKLKKLTQKRQKAMEHWGLNAIDVVKSITAKVYAIMLLTSLLSLTPMLNHMSEVVTRFEEIIYSTHYEDAIGSLIAGGASVAKSITEAKRSKEELDEIRRHNKTMEEEAKTSSNGVQGKGLFIRPYKGKGVSDSSHRRHRAHNHCRQVTNDVDLVICSPTLKEDGFPENGLIYHMRTLVMSRWKGWGRVRNLQLVVGLSDLTTPLVVIRPQRSTPFYFSAADWELLSRQLPQAERKADNTFLHGKYGFPLHLPFNLLATVPATSDTYWLGRMENVYSEDEAEKEQQPLHGDGSGGNMTSLIPALPSNETTGLLQLASLPTYHTFLRYTPYMDFCKAMVELDSLLTAIQKLERQQLGSYLMSNFYKESARLASFVDWSTCLPSAHDMAQAGFYYTGQHDQVKCPFCDVTIGDWLATDIPINVHTRWSPNCHFAKSPGSITDVGTTRVVGNETMDRGTSTTPLLFECYDARLSTFRMWPKVLQHLVPELCSAGFYYKDQMGDIVYCYSCNGSISDWEIYDEPWAEHARLFPKCPHLLNVKGSEFIENFHIPNTCDWN